MVFDFYDWKCFTYININYFNRTLFTITIMTNNKNDFQVYTLIMEEDEAGYTHWAEGLTMYIVKDGVTMKLDGNEVQQLVKTLPRTLGGTY